MKLTLVSKGLCNQGSIWVEEIDEIGEIVDQFGFFVRSNCNWRSVGQVSALKLMLCVFAGEWR